MTDKLTAAQEAQVLRIFARAEIQYGREDFGCYLNTLARERDLFSRDEAARRKLLTDKPTVPPGYVPANGQPELYKPTPAPPADERAELVAKLRAPFKIERTKVGETGSVAEVRISELRKISQPALDAARQIERDGARIAELERARDAAKNRVFRYDVGGGYIRSMGADFVEAELTSLQARAEAAEAREKDVQRYVEAAASDALRLQVALGQDDPKGELLLRVKDVRKALEAALAQKEPSNG